MNIKELVDGTIAQISTETIDNDTLYNMNDLNPISVTNAQMTALLTSAYNGFIPQNSVWFCVDSGTYTQNHFYKFTVSGTTASWTDLGGLGGGSGVVTETTYTNKTGTTIDTGATLPSGIVVFKNGVKLNSGSGNDYTVSGQVITFTTALVATDIVAVWQKAETATGFEVTSNKVTSLSASSTDTQYPSAKCVYDIVGNIETLFWHGTQAEYDAIATKNTGTLYIIVPSA